MAIHEVRPAGVHVAGIYTPAMRVSGELLFCSGIVPVDDDGNTVGIDDPGEQTRQILRTLERVLAAGGSSLRSVVALRIFSTDMANRAAINAARNEFFVEPLPTSTHVEVSGLVSDEWLLEIEAIAMVEAAT